MKKINMYFYLALVLATINLACSPKQDFPISMADDCLPDPDKVIGFDELFGRYAGVPMELSQDLILLGYVTSSDEAGNIFGRIYIQDALEEPAYGIEIRTDLLESHARFPPGSEVRINLKGLWLGIQGSGMVLGSVRDLFGTPVMDRIPASATLNHLVLNCSAKGEIYPRIVVLDSLKDQWVHTLVTIEDIEVSQNYGDTIFSQPLRESVIPLVSCKGKEIGMVVSGYADFRNNYLPKGSGSVSGVLLGGEGKYELLINHATDVMLSEPTCEERFPPVTSDKVFISEIADPDNEPQARFLEIYNAGDETVDLKGWSIVRYTNANTEAGIPADLSGLSLLPQTAQVISAWPESFEAIYGKKPDWVIRSNGPADSNGDDNMVLLDPFGAVIDVFGVPGEDGTGTSHEFEDGIALRRPEVINANPIFNPEEWQISNDSGGSGTENRIHLAPQDFTPGRHNE
jgi:hypothetical protein